MILSLFEYLRNRTCDAFLAGIADALEIVEADAATDQKKAAESVARKLGLPAEKNPFPPNLPTPLPPSGATSNPKPPPTNGQPPNSGDRPRNLLPRKRPRPEKTPPGQPPQS